MLACKVDKKFRPIPIFFVLLLLLIDYIDTQLVFHVEQVWSFDVLNMLIH